MIRPESLDGSFEPQMKAGVACVELDGEAVLMNDSDSSLHHLDPVATVVLTLFDGSATIDELAAELSEGFGADRDRVHADVLAFARRMGRLGLLEGVEADEGDGG